MLLHPVQVEEYGPIEDPQTHVSASHAFVTDINSGAFLPVVQSSLSSRSYSFLAFATMLIKVGPAKAWTAQGTYRLACAWISQVGNSGIHFIHVSSCDVRYPISNPSPVLYTFRHLPWVYMHC